MQITGFSKTLEVNALEPIIGEVGQVSITTRDEYLYILEGLQQTGEARKSVINRLTHQDLLEQLYDASREK